MPICERNFLVLAVTGVQELPGNWNSIMVWLWRCATFNILILSSEVLRVVFGSRFKIGGMLTEYLEAVYSVAFEDT